MNLTSAEARKRWAEVLRSADRGETTEITVHGRVVAVVGPPAEREKMAFTVERRRSGPAPRITLSGSQVSDVLYDHLAALGRVPMPVVFFLDFLQRGGVSIPVEALDIDPSADARLASVRRDKKTNIVEWTAEVTPHQTAGVSGRM